MLDPSYSNTKKSTKNHKNLQVKQIKDTPRNYKCNLATITQTKYKIFKT